MTTPFSGGLEGVPPPRNHRIHLRILSPGQGVAESIEIHDVPLETTIGQLKQRISLIAPSKPPAGQQRLIFAGRVLASDNAMLSEALDPACRNSSVLTIHMISRDSANSTRPQPAVLPGVIPQIAQAIPQRPVAVALDGAEARQEQAASQSRQPSPFPQPQLGQQLPQMPQLVAGGPQLPHMPAAPGMLGFPPSGVGAPPFATFPGGQPMLPQGFPGATGFQQPQQSYTAYNNQANGHSGQADQQGQQMIAHMLEAVRQQHEAVRQQHETMHRGPPEIHHGFPLPNQPHIVQQRFHAHWAPQQANQQEVTTGQSGAADQPVGSTGTGPEAQAVTQSLPNQNAMTASETTPQTQSQQTQTGPRHMGGDNSQQANQPQQNSQAPTQASNPQTRHPHQQHTQIRFQNTFRPFPPATTVQGLAGRPLPLYSSTPASQQLAMSLANVRAQSQLIAAPQTLYLLSSPTGPQALLYHNGQQYSAQLNRTDALNPTPSSVQGAATNVGPDAGAQQPRAQAGPGAGPVDLPFPLIPQFGGAAPANENGVGAAGNNGAAAAAPDVAAANANAQGGQNLLAPIQPLLQHFWLLFRVLLFAYFFIGTNDGYRRPLVLLGIALAFILFRALDAQGVLRQRVAGWWEGVVGLPPRAQGQGQAGQGQGQAVQAQALQGPRQGAAGDATGQGAAAETVRPGQGHEAVQAQDDHGLGAVRRRLRPLERAAALFVASLWPGVGENTVRARREREEEDRRAQEETERRQQEQQQRQIAEGSGEAQETPVESEAGYPRSVPINVGGTQGATGSEVERAVDLERRRRREQEGEQET